MLANRKRDEMFNATVVRETPALLLCCRSDRVRSTKVSCALRLRSDCASRHQQTTQTEPQQNANDTTATRQQRSPTRCDTTIATVRCDTPEIYARRVWQRVRMFEVVRANFQNSDSSTNKRTHKKPKRNRSRTNVRTECICCRRPYIRRAMLNSAAQPRERHQNAYETESAARVRSNEKRRHEKRAPRPQHTHTFGSDLIYNLISQCAARRAHSLVNSLQHEESRIVFVNG